MSDDNEQMTLQIEHLKWHLTQVCKLGSELSEKRFELKTDYDFMVSCFLEKQSEHAMTLLVLAEIAYYRDAGLIARTMLEGLVQLLWAGQDAVQRPRLWREFAYVSDWRKIKKREEMGKVITKGVRERVEGGLSAVAVKFYTAKARKCLSGNRPLPPDPYVINWMNISYAQCFRAVGAQRSLDFTYGDISAWHHWEAEGFGEALLIEQAPGSMRHSYTRPSLRSGAQALANGFQCLFQTLAIADECFNLGLKARLNFLRDSYVKLQCYKG